MTVVGSNMTVVGSNMTVVGSNMTVESEASIPQPNTALLSVILCFGTFFIAYFMKQFRNSKYLGRPVSGVPSFYNYRFLITDLLTNFILCINIDVNVFYTFNVVYDRFGELSETLVCR